MMSKYKPSTFKDFDSAVGYMYMYVYMYIYI
jgi:hypothetical protein